jgi:2-polyprenyl-6-methoxyphenol hydroxylase-like FAD-dependent oxidoreductase
MASVVVVGGGLAGLATALFTGRRGHEVVVVERGAPPPDGSADALAHWGRRGVAQAHFAHYFKARSTRVVREEAADLLKVLRDAGIPLSPADFGPGLEDDAGMDSRRLVYEGVLRRYVEREPRVTVVAGAVRGYLADRSTPDRIIGVRLIGGTEITADLVVDAGGRRSVSGRWLREAGLAGLAVDEVASNQHYFTRHYRLRDGHPRPANVPLVVRLPYAAVLVFGGDNGTFSLAVALSTRDPLTARVRDPDVFDRFLSALPVTAAWLEHADPVSEVHVMAGVSNRRRRLVVDGRPVATGVVLVGDTALYTNPALGHGVSLSFWMAQRAAASVERFVADPAAAAVDYQAWVDDLPGRWFEMQVAVDRAASRQFTAGLNGAGLLPPADDNGRFTAALEVLRRSHDQINQVVNRVNHLLESPSVLHDDRGLSAKVEAYLAAAPAWSAGEGPLPRRAFESLVAG